MANLSFQLNANTAVLNPRISTNECTSPHLFFLIYPHSWTSTFSLPSRCVCDVDGESQCPTVTSIGFRCHQRLDQNFQRRIHCKLAVDGWGEYGYDMTVSRLWCDYKVAVLSTIFLNVTSISIFETGLYSGPSSIHGEVASCSMGKTRIWIFRLLYRGST